MGSGKFQDICSIKQNKKFTLIIVLSAIADVLSSQTKEMMLKEIAGAYCGNCLMGQYTSDSLLTQ